MPVHTAGFRPSGKLRDADYQAFVSPPVDAAVGPDSKVDLLVVFHDFHGWEGHALWDDTKFSTTHCTMIRRVALVRE